MYRNLRRILWLALVAIASFVAWPLWIVFVILVLLSFAGPAGAQGTPLSSYPLASPGPGDVLLGNHGGTLGVGGTTSKFTVGALAGPILPYTRALNQPNVYRDGTHDDGPGINALAAALAASGGGTILLDPTPLGSCWGGPGTVDWEFGTQLVIPSNVSLVGAGQFATCIQQKANANLADIIGNAPTSTMFGGYTPSLRTVTYAGSYTTYHVFDPTVANNYLTTGQTFSDFTLDGNVGNQTGGSNRGLTLAGPQNFSIRNVMFENFLDDRNSIPLSIHGGSYGNISNIQFKSVTAGLNIELATYEIAVDQVSANVASDAVIGTIGVGTGAGSGYYNATPMMTAISNVQCYRAAGCLDQAGAIGTTVTNMNCDNDVSDCIAIHSNQGSMPVDTQVFGGTERNSGAKNFEVVNGALHVHVSGTTMEGSPNNIQILAEADQATGTATATDDITFDDVKSINGSAQTFSEPLQVATTAGSNTVLYIAQHVEFGVGQTVTIGSGGTQDTATVTAVSSTSGVPLSITVNATSHNHAVGELVSETTNAGPNVDIERPTAGSTLGTVGFYGGRINDTQSSPQSTYSISVSGSANTWFTELDVIHVVTGPYLDADFAYTTGQLPTRVNWIGNTPSSSATFPETDTSYNLRWTGAGTAVFTQPLTAASFTVPGSNTNNSLALTFPNTSTASGSSKFSILGTSGSNIAGASCNVLSLGDYGATGYSLCVDQSGNLGVKGALYSTALTATGSVTGVSFAVSGTNTNASTAYEMPNASTASGSGHFTIIGTNSGSSVGGGPIAPTLFGVADYGAGTGYGLGLDQNDNLGVAGNLTIQGSTATKASGTTWVNPSDRRIKKNVHHYTAGLDTLMALRPVTYQLNGKGGEKADGKTHVGFIAQEVQHVLPAMVISCPTKTMKDRLCLDSSDFVPTLINAVQQEQREIVRLRRALQSSAYRAYPRRARH